MRRKGSNVSNRTTYHSQQTSAEIPTMISGGSSILTLAEWQFLTQELTLSARQLQILQGLFRGLGDKAISRQLAISPHTYRTHLRRLYNRLGVRDRQELLLAIFICLRSRCLAIHCPLLRLPPIGELTKKVDAVH
jgi:DNA-binding NarL/FixJ family response regulator